MAPVETPEPEADAAKAALETYFQVANAAAMGGSLADLTALFSESCVACTSAFQDFESAQQSGLRADASRYESWVITVEERSDSQALLTSSIDFAAVNLVDGQGGIVEQVPAWGDASFAWTLTQQPDGSWLIVQGQLLS
jgi:hypothetical protein